MKARLCFSVNKQQQVIALNLPKVEMNKLYMGMSSNLDTVVEEGATIIRVGTAFFG